jgi:hypothetical protein
VKNNPSTSPVNTINDELDDDLPLLLTTETSTNGTGYFFVQNISIFIKYRTDAGSTAAGDEERWLELELEMLERMSVRTQTVEEILAEVLFNFLNNIYFCILEK